MLDFHITGGMPFMIPLSLLLVTNLGLIVILFSAAMQKKQLNSALLELVRQIGLLALVWGILSTVIGLYQAFGSLSQMTETLPLNVIMGGLQVALITAEYGLIIFVVSLVSHVVLRWLNRNSVAVNGDS